MKSLLRGDVDRVLMSTALSSSGNSTMSATAASTERTVSYETYQNALISLSVFVVLFVIMAIWVVYLLYFVGREESEVEIKKPPLSTPIDAIPRSGMAVNPMSEEFRNMQRQSIYQAQEVENKKKKEQQEREAEERAAEMEQRIAAITKAMSDELAKQRAHDKYHINAEVDRILAIERAKMVATASPSPSPSLVIATAAEETPPPPPPSHDADTDSPSSRRRPLRNSLSRSSVGDLMHTIADMSVGEIAARNVSGMQKRQSMVDTDSEF